jgi:hypothetical protein
MFCAAAGRKKKSSGGARYNDDGSVFVPSTTSTADAKAARLNITKESQLAVTALAPDESLVALEYTEERPPIILNKGMVSNIVNYYNGDRNTCPISAGGGERPPDKQVRGQNR